MKNHAWLGRDACLDQKAFICGELFDDSYKQGISADAEDCADCVAIASASGYKVGAL